MNLLKRRVVRATAVILTASMLGEILIPASAVALTDGPRQPEFSTFESVSTSGMVNEFTGAFTYNLPVVSIPGPNGVGYALSLAYHSNPSPEEEASWVGYGWTLSPGAINRVKQGFPDEYDGASIDYWNKTRGSFTATATKRIGMEVWSSENVLGGLSGGFSGYVTNRYNNIQGFGYSAGLSLQFMGAASVGYSTSDGEGAWSFNVNVVDALFALDHSLQHNEMKSWSDDKKQRYGAFRSAVKRAVGTRGDIGTSGVFGLWNLGDYTMPMSSPSYTGTVFTVSGAAEGTIMPNAGIEGGFSGTFAWQSSEAEIDRSAYGYMYSENAVKSGNSAGVMDYHVEHESSFHNRDRFLPIPFGQPDQFVVSGEGISGGFRLHRRDVGHYRPNSTSSSTDILAFNLDVQLGTSFGIGGQVSAGSQTLDVNSWGSAGYAFNGAGDEPKFFRFTDDLGGDVLYSDDDDAVRASVSAEMPSLPSSVWHTVNGGTRVGRSAFIGYNTNAELTAHASIGCDGGKSVVESRAFARSDATSAADSNANLGLFINRSDGSIASGIGEFAITKEDGTTYLYGLPVYAKGEASLQLGLFGTDAGSVDASYLAYHNVPLDTDGKSTIVGQVDSNAYATTFLLTGIVSPDYVDRTNNGLTDDDLGGYVRFNYTRVAGSTDKSDDPSSGSWYKWRSPYRGLHYERNALSDPLDDVGTVHYGYKELYYLASIETKTHIARFTTAGRKDGYPAVNSEATAQNSRSATTVGSAVPRLQELTRIDLYSKGTGSEGEVLLSTVHFEYDNSLSPGLPNAEQDAGKLTLQRVWFEYEGAVNATISPYEFGYQYLRTSDYEAITGDPDIGTTYGAIVGENDDLSTSTGTENPSYSPFNIDRWGSYQFDGAKRTARMNPWVDQTPDTVDQVGDRLFDPAAWHLKTIRLPSGGEIHVQYEQNEYRYVQDRAAMVMANLTSYTGASYADGVGTRGKYHIDTKEAGIPDDSLATVRDALRARFIDADGAREYLYFRFLYVLEGQNHFDDARSSRDTLLDRCNVEYITGYATVKDVGIDQDGLWVQFDNAANGRPLPERICTDYARTHGSGVRRFGNCNASEVGVAFPGLDAWDVAKVILKLSLGSTPAYAPGDGCRWISFSNSYVRIPTPMPKKGGGVRVKRLIMVDPGVESGEGALYGTEYRYVNEDGSCSGVATNEPSVGREENALIHLIQKRRADGSAEVYSGDDREQVEGPLGESLLPAPSVGYARVVTKNIHEGPTGSGYVVSEFNTAKDYPFDLGNGDLNNADSLGIRMTDLHGPDRVNSDNNGLFVDVHHSDVWKTQGFRFVVWNMHGQPKRVTKYALKFDADGNQVPGAVVEQLEYDYFEPGETVPIATGPSATDIVNGFPGKEMEISTESRRVDDRTVDHTGTTDAGIIPLFIFPIPFASVSYSGSLTDVVMRSHVTSKVIRYPVIQKSMTATKDGITTRTEYLAFDPTSGKPVLVKSTDGFDSVMVDGAAHDGSYYSVSIPADREYPEMGQMASNYRMSFGGSTDYEIAKRYEDGRHWLTVHETSPLGADELWRHVGRGDLIALSSGGVDLGLYHVGEVAAGRIEVLPLSYSLCTVEFEVSDVSIDVIRSGRTNQLTAQAGSLSTYRLQPDFKDVPHP